MKEFLLWLGQGRLQYVFIADAERPAECCDGCGVDELDLLAGEEGRIIHWASFRKTLAWTWRSLAWLAFTGSSCDLPAGVPG